MGNDATLNVGADTTSMVSNAKKGEQAFKGVGKAVEESGKRIQELTDKMSKGLEKSALNAAKVVAFSRAIAGGINDANQKVIELIKSMEKIGEARGATALSASQAAAEGGLDQKMVSAFLEQTGAASREDKASLVESLVKADLGLSNKRFIELTTGFNSGAFSSQQIMEKAKSGEDVNVGEQLGKLSPAALREISTRRRINEIKARETATGDELRVGQQLLETGDRASPGRAAFRELLGKADVFGVGALGVEAQKGLDAKALNSIANDAKRSANANEKTANSKRLDRHAMTDSQ